MLIEAMPWSYSRITAFDDCRYGWYLKYIQGYKPDDHGFFSGFGSLMHEILEQYLSGKATREALVGYYLNRFRDATQGDVPKSEMRLRYFEDGLEIVRNLEPLPYKPLALEHRFRYPLGERNLVGIIDYIGQDEAGNLVVIDHKSRHLKPRSNRKKPTETDLELDRYLRQLYLYALPVFEEFRDFPVELAFNCFRDGRLIKEKFDYQKLDETARWATDKITEISANEDWSPNIDYFKCKYLCSMKDHCEYYQANFGKE